LVVQVINLSFGDVFKKFSTEYKIYREVYQPGLLGIEIRNIPEKLANNVQKIVLNENEICYKNIDSEKQRTNLFIPGSIGNMKELSRRILANGDEDLGYKIVNVIKNYEEYNFNCYNIGNKQFNFDKAYVMGILNVTPDSFSDGGKYLNQSDAIKHAMQMIEDGADIIDIGGESTRPGSEGISVEEELKRVIPVINEILSQKPDTIVSIDTTKKLVASEALMNGAKIVNDISALTLEPAMADVIKKYEAAVVLMHIKGTPKTMQNNPQYDNLVKDIYDFLFERTQKAFKSGIQNIFVDPGIGFGKRFEDNFELIRRLEDFKSLGYPILIGVSRKSFIGKTLNLGLEERDTSTVSVESVAIKNGARIIRTHNVKNGVQVCRLLNNFI
jgi:dihydropteroate synthase